MDNGFDAAVWGKLVAAVLVLVVGLWGFTVAAMRMIRLKQETLRDRASLGTILALGLLASLTMLHAGLLPIIAGKGWTSNVLALLIGLIAIGVAIGGEAALQRFRGERGQPDNPAPPPPTDGGSGK